MDGQVWTYLDAARTHVELWYRSRVPGSLVDAWLLSWAASTSLIAAFYFYRDHRTKREMKEAKGD